MTLLCAGSHMHPESNLKLVAAVYFFCKGHEGGRNVIPGAQMSSHFTTGRRIKFLQFPEASITTPKSYELNALMDLNVPQAVGGRRKMNRRVRYLRPALCPLSSNTSSRLTTLKEDESRIFPFGSGKSKNAFSRTNFRCVSNEMIYRGLSFW